MINEFKQLLEIAKKGSEAGDQEAVLVSLKTLKRLLLIELMEKEISELKETLAEKKPSPEAPEEPKDDKGELAGPEIEGEGTKASDRDAVLSELKDIAAYKTEDGKLMFVLHRPTENFEYSEHADEHHFETDEVTEWFAEARSGEINQEGQNPVVSCWISEDNVIGSEKPHENTGTWGEMGKSPFASVYRVKVKPGKYKIYQELKQRV